MEGRRREVNQPPGAMSIESTETAPQPLALEAGLLSMVNSITKQTALPQQLKWNLSQLSSSKAVSSVVDHTCRATAKNSAPVKPTLIGNEKNTAHVAHCGWIAYVKGTSLDDTAIQNRQGK